MNQDNGRAYFDPVLVVGTGRCGTSAVARVLATRLGYWMGNTFRAPDDANPLGYWEDLEFRDANDSFLRGLIGQHKWRHWIERLLIDRRAHYCPWGIKDPRIADLFSFYMEYFPNARIIRCVRNREDVIESMVKHYEAIGWTREDAEKVHDVRSAALESLNPANSFEICFDLKIEDDALESILKLYLGGSHAQDKPGSDTHDVRAEI